jgi:predicted secreted protein
MFCEWSNLYKTIIVRAIMKNLIFSLLFVISTPVWAGDASQLKLIGFSKDGDYLAFQQYGITEGEGAGYSTTYFVDVKGNKYAVKPLETRKADVKQETLPDLIQQNLEQAKPDLEKLGIVTDNLGTQVIARLLSDVGADPKKVEFTLGSNPLPPVGVHHKTFVLTLHDEKAKTEADCTNLGEIKNLTLTLENTVTKKSKTLQQDKEVPKSRGCPLEYRIQDVYIFNEKYIAVFINVFSHGFEGQNMRYLTVTGTVEIE